MTGDQVQWMIQLRCLKCCDARHGEIDEPATQSNVCALRFHYFNCVVSLKRRFLLRHLADFNT